MSEVAHLPGCRCGKHKETLKEDDPWYVNAPEYYNCFFTYMKHNSHAHTLNDIAKKLNLSISAITSIERKALEKLKHRAKRLNLDRKS